MHESHNPSLTLPEASASFMKQTWKNARPRLQEARKGNDPDRPERRRRRRRVLEQMHSLYNFLDNIEGAPPKSLEEAFQRQETLSGLLVHPNIDDMLTDAVGIIGLPDNAVISVIGSGGMGGALVRTRTAMDIGFDQNSPYRSPPDLDLALISKTSIPQTKKDSLKKNLDLFLSSQSIRSCGEHNIQSSGFTIGEKLTHLKEGNIYNGLGNLDPLFCASYPQTEATGLRWNILNAFVKLGETDPTLHEKALRTLRLRGGHKNVYSEKHFGFDRFNNPPTFYNFYPVANYFSQRVAGVYNDMWDMTSSHVHHR